MRAIILVITFLFVSHSQGQDFMTYQEMESHGFSTEELDSLYPNALHKDTVKGPFYKRQEEFRAEWLSFYKDLMKYLNNNDFKWGSPTQCHMKVYFNSNGEIDHWFYNFKKSDEISEATQKEFERLIKQFMKSNRIEITSNTKFSQCVGVTFIDLEE